MLGRSRPPLKLEWMYTKILFLKEHSIISFLIMIIHKYVFIQVKSSDIVGKYQNVSTVFTCLSILFMSWPALLKNK